jgi:CRP/FNR family transcriptional regulator, cyclic AMP receptor protein
MNKPGKQIHVRLPPNIYRALKDRCAVESLSIQEYISGITSKSLYPRPSDGKVNYTSKDPKTVALNLFQECTIFNGVDLSELKRLADAAELNHFEKNQIITREGDKVFEFLYIIASGLSKVFKGSSYGKEFTFDILSKGDVFGESALFKKFTYFSSTQSIDETDIVSISKRDFLAFTFHNPDVITRIADLQQARLRNLSTKLIDMITDKAQQRVITTLKFLSDKFGNTLYFNHKLIADLSGTTSETVTRSLNHLKKVGTIQLFRGKVQIIEPDKLRS